MPAVDLVLAEASKIERHHRAGDGMLDVNKAREVVSACMTAAASLAEGVAKNHSLLRGAAWALVGVRLVRGEMSPAT